MPPAQPASHFLHKISPGITVIERGWLNCNHILLTSPRENVLIDSGYGRHAETTLAIVADVLAGVSIDASLHRLINTHCHSDHMGGNRALKEKYRCRIAIPAGEVKHVVPWTTQSCWSEEMDQYVEQFEFDDTIVDGDTFSAGGNTWEAIAAPGHDMDAMMYWCAAKRTLISGDALWERGMGFVWPSLVGNAQSAPIGAAFQAFNVIESLNPAMIIPGHGAPFSDVKSSLEFNRSKLLALANDPAKAARNVAKSLFVFALLDKGQMAEDELEGYLARVPVYRKLCNEFLQVGVDKLAEMMRRELVANGAVAVRNGKLAATMRA
jgi:glyoxylase-like metal-dependent hydrolase (beta-lactamase superfamily II)